MYIENWTLQCILTIELLIIFVPDTYAADNYLFRLGNVFPPTDGETHYQVLQLVYSFTIQVFLFI